MERRFCDVCGKENNFVCVWHYRGDWCIDDFPEIDDYVIAVNMYFAMHPGFDDICGACAERFAERLKPIIAEG